MSRACRRATELLSQKLDRPLRLGERLSLRVHLMMCLNCRRCDEQLQLMRRVCLQKRESEQDSGQKE